MPKRGDWCALLAECTGAMEGLRSGAKYYMQVGDNKIQVTTNDILTTEQLCVKVEGIIVNHNVSENYIRRMYETCQVALGEKTEEEVGWE